MSAATTVITAAHSAFQRRCEENTMWYAAQAANGAAAHTALTFPNAKAAGTAPSRFESLAGSGHSTEPVTYFHSKILPQLSLYELGCALNRAAKYGDEGMLIALVLMTRYCASTTTKPTAHMMHRLYVACLQVGMKAHSDVYYRNDTYARIAGISYLELNRLENEVTRGVEWSLQVSKDEIDALLRSPEAAIAAMAPAVTFEELRVVRSTPAPLRTPVKTTPAKVALKDNSMSQYLASPKSACASPCVEMSMFRATTTAAHGSAVDSNMDLASLSNRERSMSHSMQTTNNIVMYA
jgi:hypothetical protein